MRQIDDRRRLNSGWPGIDDDIDLMTNFLLDLKRIRERHVVAGQGQRRTHDGFTQATEHRAYQRMIGHPQADCAPFRVLQALGNFARGLQNERIRPWRHGLDHAIGPIIDSGIDTDLGQVAANQREIVLLVGLPNASNPIHGSLVTNVTA